MTSLVEVFSLIAHNLQLKYAFIMSVTAPPAVKEINTLYIFLLLPAAETECHWPVWYLDSMKTRCSHRNHIPVNFLREQC